MQAVFHAFLHAEYMFLNPSILSETKAIFFFFLSTEVEHHIGVEHHIRVYLICEDQINMSTTKIVIIEVCLALV